MYITLNGKNTLVGYDNIKEIVEEFGINYEEPDKGYYMTTGDKYPIAYAVGHFGSRKLVESLEIKKNTVGKISQYLREANRDILDFFLDTYEVEILFEKTGGVREETLLENLLRHSAWFHAKFKYLIAKNDFLVELKKVQQADLICFLAGDPNDREVKLETIKFLIENEYPISNEAIFRVADSEKIFYDDAGKKEVRTTVIDMINKVVELDSSLILKRVSPFGEKFSYLDDVLLKKAKKEDSSIFKEALKDGKISFAVKLIQNGFAYNLEDFSMVDGYSTMEFEEPSDLESMRYLLDLGADPRKATNFLHRYINTFEYDHLVAKRNTHKKMMIAKEYGSLGFEITDTFIHSIEKSKKLSMEEKKEFIYDMLHFVKKEEKIIANVFDESIRYDEVAISQWMIEKMDANINILLEYDSCPLYAVKSGEMVVMLASHGIKDVGKNGALHYVSNLEAVKMLLQHGYTKNIQSIFKKELSGYDQKEEKILLMYDFDNTLYEDEEESRKLVSKNRILRDHILKPSREENAERSYMRILKIYEIKSEIKTGDFVVRIGDKNWFYQKLDKSEDVYIGKSGNFYTNGKKLLQKIIEKQGNEEAKMIVDEIFERKDRQEKLINSFKKANAIAYIDYCGSMTEKTFWRELEELGYIKRSEISNIEIGSAYNPIDVGGGLFVHFDGGRDGIDDFYINVLVTKGKRTKSQMQETVKGYSSFLSIVRELAEDKEKICWECGRNFSFNSITIDNSLPAWKAFNLKISRWEEGYCGC